MPMGYSSFHSIQCGGALILQNGVTLGLRSKLPQAQPRTNRGRDRHYSSSSTTLICFGSLTMYLQYRISGWHRLEKLFTQRNIKIKFECISRSDRLNEDVMRILKNLDVSGFGLGQNQVHSMSLTFMDQRVNAPIA